MREYKKRLLIGLIPLFLAGCWPFGGKEKLADKTNNIPSGEAVSGFLDQSVTSPKIHCGDKTPPKNNFHDDYAKIKPNYIGQGKAFKWDKGWNSWIDKTLTDDFSILLSDDMLLNETDLIGIGCPGLNSAGVNDKKRFYALFMAALASSRTGLDANHSGENGFGLLGLSSDQIQKIGGRCRGLDDTDLREAIYALPCGLEILTKQLKGEGNQQLKGRLFPPADCCGKEDGFFFDTLSNDDRYKVMNFFKNHASSQFAFCNMNGPKELLRAKVPGEIDKDGCQVKEVNRVKEDLVRDDEKSKKLAPGSVSADDQNAASCVGNCDIDGSKSTTGGEFKLEDTSVQQK